MFTCLLLEQIGDVGTPFMELVTPVIPRVGEIIETSRPGKDEIAHYRVLGVSYGCPEHFGDDERWRQEHGFPKRVLEDIALEVEFLGVFNCEIE